MFSVDIVVTLLLHYVVCHVALLVKLEGVPDIRRRMALVASLIPGARGSFSGQYARGGPLSGVSCTCRLYRDASRTSCQNDVLCPEGW